MPGFLSPYRVLDLSDERGLLAGHMLAQLGADGVQVERLAGSPARAFGSFAVDAPFGKNSFYWSAYASGKRSLACGLASPAGQAVLRRLIERADVLIELADAGQRQAWCITPEQTQAIHPALIHVSIPAFGTSGPKAGYAASDLTAWWKCTLAGVRPVDVLPTTCSGGWPAKALVMLTSGAGRIEQAY